MNIVVCIKQVPDTAEVKINPETNTLIRDGVENIMNPFDRQALETALILKDTSGAKVIRRFDGTAAGDGYFERGHCDGS